MSPGMSVLSAPRRFHSPESWLATTLVQHGRRIGSATSDSRRGGGHTDFEIVATPWPCAVPLVSTAFHRDRSKCRRFWLPESSSAFCQDSPTSGRSGNTADTPPRLETGPRLLNSLVFAGLFHHSRAAPQDGFSHKFTCHYCTRGNYTNRECVVKRHRRRERLSSFEMQVGDCQNRIDRNSGRKKDDMIPVNSMACVEGQTSALAVSPDCFDRRHQKGCSREVGEAFGKLN